MKSTVSLISLLLLISILTSAQSPGSLDNSFGDNGRAFASPSTTDNPYPPYPFNRPERVVIAGNRIYVIGLSGGGFGLAVFDLTGKLDKTFSGDGVVIVKNGSSVYNGTDVAIQSDGKILIGGFNDNDFVVARLNANGTLDSSWGTTGFVETDITGTWDRIKNLAIQSDGKIIAAGYSGKNGNDVSVTRYNTNGTVDTSFGVNGFIVKDFNGKSDRIEGITIQSDDKIVLTGTSNSATQDGFIVRLTKNGSYDNTFNGTGIVFLDYGSTEGFFDVKVLPDGKLLVAGIASSSGGVFRYHANGTIDLSFANAGYALASENMFASEVAYHSTGKYIVFGYNYGLPSRDFTIAAITPEGQLDNCFGSAGLFRTDMGNVTDDYGLSGAMQTDGKLLQTGYVGDSRQFSLIRVTGPTPLINTSVTATKNLLAATATGATFQWVNCTTGNPLPGETASLFTATATGSYKVVITKDGCSVSSTCYDIENSITGIEEKLSFTPKVYPNPVKETLTIQMGFKSKMTQVHIVNTAGVTINTLNFLNADSFEIEMSSLSSDLYFIKIQADERSAVAVVVKN